MIWFENCGDKTWTICAIKTVLPCKQKCFTKKHWPLEKTSKQMEIAPFKPLFGSCWEQVLHRGWYFAGDITVSFDFHSHDAKLLPALSFHPFPCSGSTYLRLNTNTTHSLRTDPDLLLPHALGVEWRYYTLLHMFSVCGMSHITHRLKTHTHLIEFVDVDLTLFVPLWTHIHGSSDQKDVSVIVTVDIMRLENTAEIGADLRRTWHT